MEDIHVSVDCRPVIHVICSTRKVVLYTRIEWFVKVTVVVLVLHVNLDSDCVLWSAERTSFWYNQGASMTRHVADFDV